MVDKLPKYLRESAIAIEVLSERIGIKIDQLNFQNALANSFGYEQYESQYVANEDLSAEEMIARLQDYPFEKHVEIDRVVLPESVIPGNLPVAVNEQSIKSKGEIWVIHKYDADPFPSNPHAHNRETGLKLHLGNGDLYDSKNNYTKENISKKHLLVIRRKVNSSITLPTLTV